MAESIEHCGDTESDCRCNQAADHAPPHICDCGGSWRYNEAGEFDPVTYPGGDAGAFNMIARLYAAFGTYPGEREA